MNKRKKEILAGWKISHQLYEKQLTYVSGGAIALSVGILQTNMEFVKNDNSMQFSFAVGCFAACLIANLFSHVSSVSSHRYEIEKSKCLSDWFDYLTRGLNAISVLTLVVGVILLSCAIVIRINSIA